LMKGCMLVLYRGLYFGSDLLYVFSVFPRSGSFIPIK
jgi:hypothetical protein